MWGNLSTIYPLETQSRTSENFGNFGNDNLYYLHLFTILPNRAIHLPYLAYENLSSANYEKPPEIGMYSRTYLVRREVGTGARVGAKSDQSIQRALLSCFVLEKSRRDVKRALG